MSGVRDASVTVLTGGILLLTLTGCHSSPGSDSASGATSSPSPSPSAAAGTPATATASGPADSRSGTTSAASHGSSAPAAATARAHAETSHAPAYVPGCRSLVVSNTVKTAVTDAYRRSFPRFAHIEPVPHRFFYGQCGALNYAATPFQPTSGAAHEELVGMQDEGSAMKYFRTTSGGNWTYIASDGFPSGPHGCADVPQIPRALAMAWANCQVKH